MESLSGNLGGHHTWLGICKACLACPRSWVPALCLPAFGKHHPLCCQCLVDPCIVSDTFRASRPGCPGPSRGKEPSLVFCSVPTLPSVYRSRLSNPAHIPGSTASSPPCFVFHRAQSSPHLSFRPAVSLKALSSAMPRLASCSVPVITGLPVTFPL